MFVTCPKCFSADDVSYRRLPDRMVEYVCAGEHGEHVWIASQSTVGWTADTVEGVTDELMEPLSQCVVEGEPFVEYGVVEHRLMLSRPDLFAAHVRDRGHVMLAPGVATASSVRFAVALGRLVRTGELVARYGPATGAWSYNSQVTYRARPPAPSAELSWSAYCAQHGRPDTWTDDDRAAATGV